jgi:hypothetical protein
MPPPKETRLKNGRLDVFQDDDGVWKKATDWDEEGYVVDAEPIDASGTETEEPGEPAKPKPAAPKSTAQKAADLVRPPLSHEYPTLSALGQVGADLFGGATGMGENMIEGAKAIPSAVAHPIDTAKSIAHGIAENPATAGMSMVPYAVKKIPGVGTVASMAGHAVDQIRKGDARPLADKFADILTAGASSAVPEMGKRVAVTKPAVAAKQAAGKAGAAARQVPGIREAMDAKDVLANLPAKAKAKLKGFADDKIISSLGGTKKQNELLKARNPGLPDTLREVKAIPVLGTPERILKRVEGAKDAAGENVGNLIEGAHQKLTATPEPVPMLAPVGSGLKGDLLPDKPMARTFRIIEAEAPKRTGRVVDANEIADSLASDLDNLRTVPGMEASVGSIEKQLDTLRKNGTMTLPQAQKLRQEIDASINWNKRVPEMARAQEFLYQIRSSLSSKMNDVVGALEGVDSLKKANRKYSDLATAENILEKNIPRGQSNRSVSLTDTIAAAGGAASGGVPMAAAALGGNKLLRTYGDTLAARAADALAAGTPLSPLGKAMRAGFLFGEDDEPVLVPVGSF